MSHVAAPPNTWTIHLQTHDDLLLVINAKDMFAAAEFADERAYYRGALGKTVGTAEARRVRDWSAGLAVYDISKLENPRRIGFMPVEGGGIHRIWYTGGRWAYVSVLLDGFTDYIFMTVDMSNPAQPREAGRWWIPGMNLAAAETPPWEPTRRYGLHHAIIHGDTAYAAWRDAGMVVLDIADRAKPKLIVHRNWSPPYGGGTHNCLPLPDRDLLVVLDEAVLDHQEDGLKLIWVFDNRTRENPVSISSFPTPAEADYKAKGGHFGPHNIHENRPGSFVSTQLIFATYQNAGNPCLRHVQPLHSEGSRRAGTAATGEARGYAAKSRARHSIRRRICGCERSDLRHRLQCRPVCSGICRLNFMPGLAPGIHVFDARKSWMAGTSPAMTMGTTRSSWRPARQTLRSSHKRSAHRRCHRATRSISGPFRRLRRPARQCSAAST